MLRISGVPEHFNYAWRLLQGKSTIPYTWTDYATGSGAMLEALRKGDQDLCVALTEAVVAALANGQALSVVGTYVASPLVWGIHLPKDGDFDYIINKAEINIAISRYGSGSHIMAYVLADRFKLPLDKLRFKVIDHLNGAVASHAAGNTDIFLWERATTQPAVAAGHFTFYDVLPAPWPAFLIVGNANTLYGEKLTKPVSQLLKEVLLEANKRHNAPDFVQQIVGFYHLDANLVAEWAKHVKWSDDGAVDAGMMHQVHRFLVNCGLQLPDIERFDTYILKPNA